MNHRPIMPLTDEHCAALDHVLGACPPALEFARKCQECGLDTSQYIDTLQQQQQMASKLKATFFPGRP